jgi:hypothetical protein
MYLLYVEMIICHCCTDTYLLTLHSFLLMEKGEGNSGGWKHYGGIKGGGK